MEFTPEYIWNKILDSNILTEDDTSVMYYSFLDLESRLSKLKSIFNDEKILHTVAIKTNPHPEILKKIVSLGFGLEAASFEEVLLAISCGCNANKISYNSPVKTSNEISKCSRQYSGLLINVNSFDELHRLKDINNLNVSLRINPVIDPGTNSLYNVSTQNSKFGISICQKDLILEAILKHNIKGLHIHAGSQMTNLKATVNGIKKIYDIALEANQLLAKNKADYKIEFINIGGGIPSGNEEVENTNNMESYVNLIKSYIPNLFNEFNIITEFGQWIHKLNGYSFSKIEYIKQYSDNNFIAYVHIGGDMFVREIYTDLNRLKIQAIYKDKLEDDSVLNEYDIAGPLCYNGDFLLKNVKMNKLNDNDILVILNTGANMYGLWSRHCSRTIPKFVTFDQAEKKISVLSERFNPFINIY